MSKMDKQFFVDLKNNDIGLMENALPIATGAIAEPVAGLAAIYHALSGGDNASGVVNAVREAMTYKPRTEAGKMYQQAMGEAVGRIVQSAPVRTWQHGVDIAGDYSPAAGAVLQTVPTAIGVAAGAKQAMKAGRGASLLLDRVENYAPSKSGIGGIGMQEGSVGIKDIYQVSQAQQKAYDLGRKHRQAIKSNPDISKEDFYWSIPADENNFLGSVYNSPAQSAYYESGLRGAKMPEPAYGYRWGDPPKEGYSMNHVDQSREHGVSMAAVDGVDYQWAKMSNGKDSRKYSKYTGMLLDPEHFWGSDGEPLMIRVRPAED
jgi:hypothetical protein